MNIGKTIDHTNINKKAKKDGADIIGTSSGVKIMEELKSTKEIQKKQP